MGLSMHLTMTYSAAENLMLNWLNRENVISVADEKMDVHKSSPVHLRKVPTLARRCHVVIFVCPERLRQVVSSVRVCVECSIT